MKEKVKHRGGKREGAGRKSQGKQPYTVTLTTANVDKAKRKEANFSGLLDKLLAEWNER
jgi:Post-segregation antitoxin CcdA